MSVTIATSGTLTAGDSFILECYINGTNRPAMFEWLGPPNNQSLMTNLSNSRVVKSNSTVTTLQFTTLQASHNGLYTCQATMRSRDTIITVEESYPVRVNCKSI